MLIGIACALGAGLLWGLVFIVPVMLGDYPPMMLSFGRYVAYGLVALIPAWFDRHRIAALTRTDWVWALKLALVGNVLYYCLLAGAIQKAGTPVPAMLVGTLPVVIALCSNWLPAHATEAIAWRRLVPSLVLLLAGLLLVNADELGRTVDARAHSTADYLIGCALALAAVAAWTWFPIMNSRYIRANPQVTGVTWSTAQGLATLPLAVLGLLGYGLFNGMGDAAFAFPFGPRPGVFIVVVLLMGLLASWVGAILWNQTSARLPTSLAGQMIVFETLFALLYTFTLRASWPPLPTLAGVLLLCAGVTLGVRAFRHQVT